MKSFERSVEPFVVPCQSAEASCPSEGAFHHLAAREQNEAPFGHRMLDHFQLYAVLLCGLGSVGPGLALVDIGQIHVVACHLLHLLGQRGYLSTVPFIGRGHGQRHQMPPRVDRDVDLRSFAPLGTVITRPRHSPAWTARCGCPDRPQPAGFCDRRTHATATVAGLKGLYVGHAAGNVRDIFAKARAVSPAILFIDELDLVAPARKGGGNDVLVHEIISLML